jgi:iron complex outermembrane recepter protein
MNIRTFSALAGSGLLLIGSAAGAETPAASKATAEVPEYRLEEVVVTARRKEESLQDVPQTVNAVSGATIEKFNIIKFDDVAAVTPGLTLTSGGNTGYTTVAAMRGIAFNVESGAAPTVAFYLNDLPVESNFLFQAMYDVGQVEVLRGPQGTLRGRASPSGAITVTTRKPSLAEFGGYGMVSASNLNAINANGALNLPIISDKLAVRIAALTDKNEFDGVTSVNNPAKPESKTDAGRISVSWKPLDTLVADLGYHRLVRHIHAYDQVTGSGGPGGSVVNTGVVYNPAITSWSAPPAGFNGPVIASSDRLGVADGISDNKQVTDVYSGKLEWNFLGQKLSYVGGYNKLQIVAQRDTDDVNFFRNYGFINNITSGQDVTIHELRLSSEKPLLDSRLDYTVGVYSSRTRLRNSIVNGQNYLQGAFGNPLAPPVYGLPNNRYKLDIFIDATSETKELSEFATLTWHFSDRTELAVGGRYIDYKPKGDFVVSNGPGFDAFPDSVLAAFGLTCAALQFPVTYPGTCDAPVPAGPVFATTENQTARKFVYNASFSHRFTDDFMMYVNTGTSFRPGPSVQGINNGGTDPGLNALVNLKNETSTSYELGAKSSFLDKRIRLDVALYHQKFGNLITRANSTINYLGSSGAGTAVDQYQFSYNADAIVDGADVEASWQVLPHWSLGAAFSYSDGHVDNQPVPCNDSNFDGVPDSGAVTVASFQAAGKAVAYCRSSQSVSRTPFWNTTLQTEYSQPVTDGVEAFARGLYTYYPQNRHASPDFVADSYGLLNVYAGVRSPSGAWEVSLFVKNATNTGKTLTKDNVAIAGVGGSGAYFGSSGYYATSYTPRREVGASVRYAFGSR